MNKVRITVLKTTVDEELAQEYGAENMTPCPKHTTGQVYYADYAKPEGFCDEAWKAIYQYAFALAQRGETCFTQGAGSENPASPYAAATTGCGRSFSNWKRPKKRFDHLHDKWSKGSFSSQGKLPGPKKRKLRPPAVFCVLTRATDC